ncbi:hypothetical protein [Pseudovibrio ascidiaceicola]|uniref:hypothetical protein n=1 Tax=Pseudovibrio ascidiaceicola TaxID=285279 RepID=UPI000B881A9A|nr:hypothetical protein [Pseudovibrio ascidiaceicola]
MRAISRDHKLTIKYYKAIPALLHGIAPNVDRDRNLLKAQLTQSKLISRASMSSLTSPVTQADDYEYITDGKLLVAAAKGITLSGWERE